MSVLRLKLCRVANASAKSEPVLQRGSYPTESDKVTRNCVSEGSKNEQPGRRFLRNRGFDRADLNR